MGRKVTDLMGSLYFEIGQNFKNRGHLYNKHTKFINRGLKTQSCPLTNCLLSPQKRNNNRTRTDIITLRIKNPLTRLCDFVILPNFIFADFLMFVHCKPSGNGIAHYTSFGNGICFRSKVLFACRTTNSTFTPNNVLIFAFGTLVKQVSAWEGYKSKVAALWYEKMQTFVVGGNFIVNVVENTTELSLGFKNHSVLSEVKGLSVKLRATHLRVSAHYGLVHWLWFALVIAWGCFTNSLFIAFGRSAVNVIRYIDLLQNLDDVVKRISACLNLKDEIASVRFPISVCTFILAFIAKGNKPAFLGEKKMTCIVVFDFTEKPCSSITDTAASGLNLPRCGVVDLGIYERHSDSNIKGILFVTTFIGMNVVYHVSYNEIICPFVVYHIVLNNLNKGKKKTLTPVDDWHKGFYIMMGLRLHNMSKTTHHVHLVTMQKYNEYLNYARNVNSELTFERGRNFRKIAAIKNSQVYNTLKIRMLKRNSKWSTCQRNIYGCFCGLPP